MLEYRELKIRITRDAAGAYRTYAEGPSGTASGSFVPPYSSQELDDVLREISGQVGRARRRRVEAPDTARVKHFGGVLFDALFEDDIRDLYSGSLQAAEDKGKGLRVTLSLKDAPELMLVPWEFLYDEPNFLSISDSTPVVRYLDLKKSRGPIQIVPPLHIFGMVSSPTGVVELDVDREIENIERALARLKAKGAVDITWLDKATLEELQSCLRGGPYHVFHYIGHGEYDDEQDDGVLLLEDDRGRPDPVSGVNLGATLANHRTLRLATLNSCEGGRNAVDDPFAGVATSLVQSQIPAVVAMQFEITDRMASVFSKWLYESLAAGLPVDQALSQARLAIFNQRRGIEWGTPVLFMRVQDGRIFEAPDGERDDVTPGGDKEPVVEVLPWWRKRIAALIAAVVVALLAVSAVGYAMSRSNNPGTTPPPPPPPPPAEAWSSTPMSAMDKVKGVVAGRQGEAFAVGVSDGRPSVQHLGPGGWSKETFDKDRSGVMKAVAFSSGVAIAAGRVNDENGDVDAGMWRRGSNGSWSLNCPDSVCGDTAPGAVDGRQQILDLTVTGTETFVAVGRESARGQPGQWRPVVWRLNPGTTWSRVEDTGLSTFSGYMTGVVSRGNLLMAVGTHGADGAAWVSNDDGVHWTEKRAAALNAQGKRVEPQAVTVTPEGFFAVGLNRNPPSPVAWFSKNGSAWRRSSIQDSAMGQQIFDVAPTTLGLVAVGTYLGTKQAAVWRSTNGKQWSPVSSSSFSDKGQPGMSSVDVLSDKTVLAVGSANNIGRVWTQTPP